MVKQNSAHLIQTQFIFPFVFLFFLLLVRFAFLFGRDHFVRIRIDMNFRNLFGNPAWRCRMTKSTARILFRVRLP